MHVRMEHERETDKLSLFVTLDDISEETSFLDPSSLVSIGGADSLQVSVNDVRASFTPEGTLLKSSFSIPVLQNAIFQLKRKDNEIHVFDVNFTDDMLFQITASPSAITLDESTEISLSVDSKSGAVVDDGIGSTQLLTRNIVCQSASDMNVLIDVTTTFESHPATLPFLSESSRTGTDLLRRQIASRLIDGELIKCDLELSAVRNIRLNAEEIPADPYISNIQSQNNSPITSFITVYSKPTVISIFR